MKKMKVKIREEKAYAYSTFWSLDLLSTLWLPLILFFFFLLLQWCFAREFFLSVLSHGSLPFLQPSSSTLEAKSQLKRTKNRMRKRRTIKKSNDPGIWPATATMGWPWLPSQPAVASSHHVLDLPLCCILVHLLSPSSCPGSPMLGHFWAFLQASWIHLSSIFIIFS